MPVSALSRRPTAGRRRDRVGARERQRPRRRHGVLPLLMLTLAATAAAGEPLAMEAAPVPLTALAASSGDGAGEDEVPTPRLPPEDAAEADAPAPAADGIGEGTGGPVVRFIGPQAGVGWYAGFINILTSRPHDRVEPVWLPLPLLTRLTDYTFTDQVWVARESTGLIRFVQAPSWEFMLAGTIDTAGYEKGDSPALAGMSARRWTVNAGVGGAWRGDRLFFEAIAVSDILDRHGGQSYIASAGMPLRLFGDHMQLVPHVDLIHRSGAYVDYYYGVRASEARPGRPAYAPGASTGIRFAARGNWRFGERWALAGRVGVELLGSEIVDSPVVEQDTSWTFTLSVLRRLGRGDAPARNDDPARDVPIAFDALQTAP